MRKGWCFWAFVSILFLALSACKKDRPPVPPDQQVDVLLNDSSSILIVNEGNFMFGNASLTLYESATGNITEDIFKQVNQQALGDVAQSLCLFDNKLFVVVNNSSKVEVLNPHTYTRIGTINNLFSPRYFQGIHSGKAYVTDLYQQKITVVNPADYSISGFIDLPGWTERMLLFQNKVFVNNINSDKVYVVDVQSDSVTDSIFCGRGNNSMVLDRNKHLWVLSSGNSSQKPAITIIDPLLNQTLYRFELDLPSASQLQYNPFTNECYFLAKDVYKAVKQGEQFSVSKFISADSKNLYSIRYITERNLLLMNDAKDYISKGTCHLYRCETLAPVALGQFQTGIIPGDILFVPH
jgi:hypothetical protein